MDMTERFKKYAVSDVATVEAFLAKYYRHDRYRGRGEEYAQAVLSSQQRRLDEEGYAIISHHDSNTGEIVTFYLPSATKPTP